MRRLLLTSLGAVVLFTVMSVVYMFVVLGIGQAAFSSQANGSLVSQDGRVVGSSLLGQSFTDSSGNPLPRYFQPRPTDPGYDYNPQGSGSLSLGPTNPLLIGYVPGISILDENGDLLRDASGHYLAADPFATPADPYCVPVAPKTGDPVTENLSSPYTGVGAASQYAMNPDGSYQCDPNTVPERAIAYRRLNGLAANAQVPVDAVTVSFSGLDPDISIDNADLQAPRVARVRHLPLSVVQGLVGKYTSSRPLGILGEPGVNVLELNMALDRLGPS